MGDTKTCRECNRKKPLKEFNQCKGMKDGRINSCKNCRSEYDKNHSQARKEYKQRERAALRKLPVNHPERVKRRERCKARYHANKEAYKAKQKEYYQRNKKAIIEAARERLYGLERGGYKRILDVQGGKCAICRREKPPGTKPFHIDHNHTTGEVRGILCQPCNHILGNANDLVEVLLAAVEYLNNPPARAVLATSAGS